MFTDIRHQSSVTLTTWRDHTKITDLTRWWVWFPYLIFRLEYVDFKFACRKGINFIKMKAKYLEIF